MILIFIQHNKSAKRVENYRGVYKCTLVLIVYILKFNALEFNTSDFTHPPSFHLFGPFLHIYFLLPVMIII